MHQIKKQQQQQQQQNTKNSCISKIQNALFVEYSINLAKIVLL